jgi:competence protein ComEA
LKAGWISVVALLVIIIIAGGIVIGTRYGRSRPVEISVIPEQPLQGDIYVGGEVNSPGLYPLKEADSIDDIIQAAGGVTDVADTSRLELNVPGKVEIESPQKVDINRAELWLLEALPGIGDVRARAIIDYRQRNGPFRTINELVKVEGIGVTTLESIRHLITVAD